MCNHSILLLPGSNTNSWGGSNVYPGPRSMFWAKIRKYHIFSSENYHFTAVKYYTIIDFKEVGIRIYQPENVKFTEAARPRWISLLRVDKFLYLSKLKSIIVLLYDLSTIYIKSLISFWYKHCTANVILTNLNNCFEKKKNILCFDIQFKFTLYAECEFKKNKHFLYLCSTQIKKNEQIEKQL